MAENRTSKVTTLAKAAAALAAVVGASLMGATSASAAGYDDYFAFTSGSVLVNGHVDFVGNNRVDVGSVMVRDAPGDAYCTVVTAQLRSSSAPNWNAGNRITLGSVCGGRTGYLPFKTITTGYGDHFGVVIDAHRGTGGPIVGEAFCRKGSDALQTACS